MADSKVKSTALLLGMPEDDSEPEEEVDVGADREEAAGSAFAAAVKAGDGAGIAAAFRELMEACGHKSEEE
jgi:hypothetical protein